MEKFQHVGRVLSKHFYKMRTRSADWGGQNVWDIKSDGISEGIFIFEDDDSNFILLARSEENEETRTSDLFTYTVGSGELGKLINIAKSLKS